MMNSEILQCVLEECKILRSEMHLFFSTQYTALGFGITVNCALSAFGANKPEQFQLCSLIFGVIIPVVSITVLLIWIGSVEKTIRISLYIKQREEYVNSLLGADPNSPWQEKPLGWENWIRLSRTSDRCSFKDYIAIIAFFLGSALFSSLLTIFIFLKGNLIAYSTIYIWISMSVILVATIFFYKYSKSIISNFGK